MIADLVATLIAAGTPPDVAATVVAQAFAEGVSVHRTPVDTAAEKRRAYDRERKKKERESGGSPVESGGSPEKALTLKKDNKRVRAAKHPCPPDWMPNDEHYRKAAELNISRAAVDAKAVDMRLWAGSTGALKVDWDLTFHGFLRRDAAKIASAPPIVHTAHTITPASPSWAAWKAHYRDGNQNFRAALMDKSAADGKAFTVPSEWPPGHQRSAA